MTIRPFLRQKHAAVIAAALLLTAATARAQGPPRDSDDVEPWRAPASEPATTRATSSLEATQATESDQRQARTLATAIFARPAAAQRAGDKVDAAHKPPVPPAQPRAEWLSDEGLHFGGRGLELTTPF